MSKKSQPKKSAKLSKHKPLSPNTPKTNLRKTGKADKSVKTVNQGKAKHSGKRSRNPNSVQHQDTTILQVNSAVKINESVLSSLSEGLHLLKH